MALALPAMAQRSADDQQAEIQKLKAVIRDLEAKLNATKEGDKRKGEEKKPESKKNEDKKDDDKKGESKKSDEKKGEDKKPEPKKGEEKKPESKKPEEKKQEAKGDEKKPTKEAPGSYGFKMPNLDNLSPDEQAIFKKLMAKIHSSEKPETRKPEPQKPGSKGEPNKQNLEERLDRLEKLVQELARNQSGKK